MNQARRTQLPELVSLSFARPEGFGHLRATEYAAMVLEMVRAVEEGAAAERRRTGATVLGLIPPP